MFMLPWFLASSHVFGVCGGPKEYLTAFMVRATGFLSFVFGGRIRMWLVQMKVDITKWLPSTTQSHLA